MPPFLYPVILAGGLLLFLGLFKFFRRNRAGRSIVRGITGTDTPGEVIQDHRDAKARALAALPEAERELASEMARVRELRELAGLPTDGQKI